MTNVWHNKWFKYFIIPLLVLVISSIITEIVNNSNESDGQFEKYYTEVGPATKIDGIYMLEVLIRNNTKTVQNSLHVSAEATKNIYLKLGNSYLGYGNLKTGDGLFLPDGGILTVKQNFSAKNIFEAFAENVPAYASVGLRIFSPEYFNLTVKVD